MRSASLEVRDLGHGFFRVIVPVGFLKSPDVPRLLALCTDRGIVAEPMRTTYYLGRQTLLTTGIAKLAYWRKILFALLARRPAAQPRRGARLQIELYPCTT